MLVKPFRTRRYFYAYDTNTNAIAKISPAVHDYLNGTGDQSPELKAAIRSGLETARQETGLFQEHTPTLSRPFFDDAEIRHAVGHRRKTLMLQVTDACNLRCAYCIYGGTYEGRPLHGKSLMTWDVARRAIDDFVEHSDQTEGELGLGFYGGEPFVNFKLMKRSLAYFKKVTCGRETVCALTTNGTLLDDRAVDWMVENSVAATISIDGPKLVHDTHRRTVKGEPTFESILAKLDRFRRRHAAFFDQMLRLSVTLVPPVDFETLDQFFAGFPVTRLNVSHVDSFGNGHAAPTADKRQHYAGFGKMLAKFRSAAISGQIGKGPVDPENALVDAMFGPTIRKIHNRPQTARLPEEFTPAGLCVPGADKTYVSADGSYFVCEKVDGNDNMRLGDTHDGLDPERVLALSHAFYAFLGSRCSKCWASRLCGMCFAHTVHNHALDAEKRAQNCHLKRENLALMLAQYCEIRERNLTAFAALDA